MILLKTAFISLISIAVLFILTKLMGNKQLSQLSMFDYIIGISIGSIAAECSFEDNDPERMVVAMAIYALSAVIVSRVTERSTHMRKILIGRPLILLDNGKLYRENFKKAKIDLSDFLTHCRNQGYFDLKQIRTAVFEYNGSLSILPAEADRPLTPSDIELAPEQQKLMVNVILDGNINEKNLKRTGNDLTWLEKELHKQGFHGAHEVYLGAVNTVDNTLSLYSSKVENDRSDPFE